MTTDRRFERDLPGLLEDLARAPTPDYRDFVVQQSARMRQRPRWTFPERWIPMTALTTRLATLPRVPLRMLAIAAALLLALLVGIALFAGSGQRLPAPFGPAANGQIIYASGGDIFTVDPSTGRSTPIVTGLAMDVRPVWSRDGAAIAFARATLAGQLDRELIVADASGGHPVAVVPSPGVWLVDFAFSPNGRQILYTAGPPGNLELWVVNTDGTGRRSLGVGPTNIDAWWRPPTGAEIVFAGGAKAGEYGIFAVDVLTGAKRTIVAPSSAAELGWVRISPDGGRIAYSVAADVSERNTYEVHVIRADGTGDVVIPKPPGATFQDAPEWSNDGTRLAIVRGFSTRDQEIAMAAVPADGSGFGTETRRGLTGCCGTLNEWSPDDRSILMVPTDPDAQSRSVVIWDPTTGDSRVVAWTVRNLQAWQRRAP